MCRSFFSTVFIWIFLSIAGSLGAQTPVWTDVQKADGVAYLLRKSPAQIMRYDLNTTTWLDPILLADIPSAFVLDGAHIFLASGRKVERINRDGSNLVHVANTAEDITSLFVDGNVLIINRSASSRGYFTSVNKTTFTTIHSFENGYALSGASIAPSLNKLFGRSTGMSPSDIVFTTYDDAGTFTGGRDGPYHGRYPNATRTWVFPDDTKVVDSSGTIYNTSDLTYNNSFGVTLTDIAFRGVDVPIILAGDKLISFSNTLLETGRYTLALPARSLLVHGEQLFAFQEDANATTKVVVEVVDVSNVGALDPGEPISPEGLAYNVDSSAIGADGILYLLNKSLNSLFRWDVEEQRYLETIPLPEACNFIVYSENVHRIYVYAPSKKVYRIDLDVESPAAAHHLTVPLNINKMIPLGSDLLALQNGSWDSQWLYDASGNLLKAHVSCCYHKYHFYDEASGYLFYDSYKFVYLGDGTFGPREGGYISSFNPIALSQNGQLMIDAAGRIYSTSSTTQIDSISNNVTHAAWNSTDMLFTFKSAVSTATTTAVQKWNQYYSIQRERVIPGKPIQLYAHGEQVVVITDVDGTPLVTFLNANLDLLAPPTLATPALAISKFSATAATLVWEPILGAELYLIERKRPEDSEWTEIGTAPFGSKAFTDTTLSTGFVYQFRLKATNGDLESDYSDVVELDLQGVVDERVDPREVDFIPDDVLISDDDVIYLLSGANNSIFAWDVVSQDWATTIPLEGAPTRFTYSATNNALYTLYPDGRLSSIGLAVENPVEIFFAQVGTGSRPGLVAAGEHIIAGHYSSFDAAGNLVDQRSLSYPFNDGVWNAVRRNIYHLRDNASPNDLLFTNILEDGRVGIQKDSPYHSSTMGWTHPVRVDPAGTIVILGSGRIFNAVSLEQVGALASPIQDAIWIDGALVTLTNSVIYSHSSDTYGSQAEVALVHTGLRLLPTSDGRVAAISRNTAGATFIDLFDGAFEISPPATLAKPAGLSCAIQTANSVSLSWRDIAGENGYRIGRKSGGSDTWETVGTTTANITTFSDNTVAAGTAYQFRVIAFNGDLESEASDVLSITLSTPSIPGNFAAIALGGFGIRLEWDGTSLASGYRLERRSAGSSTWSLVQEVGSEVLTFTNNGLTPNTEYDFRLRAFNALGSSDWISVSAKTDQVLPGTPSLFFPSATAVSVDVSWANGSYSDTTILERQLAGSAEWQELAIVPVPTSSFVDQTVQSSTSYVYRAKARNSAGDSAYSNLRSITTPALPPPPTPMLAVPYPESATSFLLNWQKVIYAESYELDYRPVGADAWINLAQFGPNDTTFLHSGLTTGQTYEYRLRAGNDVGYSSYSMREATAVHLVALLWDNFEPQENFRMWYRLTGGTAVDGGQGFDTGSALWFGSGVSAPETMAADLRQGGYLHFSLRAGNEAEDGDGYWRNFTTSRSLAVQYSVDGYSWVTLQNFSLTFPSLKEWTRFTIPLPQGAYSATTRFRWSTQTASAAGNWAIDNIEVRAPEPPQVPWVDYVQPYVLNSTTVHLSWPVPNPVGVSTPIDPEGVYLFQVERREGGGLWQTIGLVDGTFSPVFLDYIAPSNENLFYRVRTLAPWDEALPSLTSMVTTISQLDEWRLINFGTAENTGPSADAFVDAYGLANIQRYAFGLETGEKPRSYVTGSGQAGVPAVWLDRNTNRLNVGFMRRMPSTNPEIEYVVEFSDDLIQWLPLTSPAEATALRGNWEEVRFEQPSLAYLGERCFVRVQIVRR